MKNQKEIMEKIYKVCGYIKGIVDEIIPEKWDSFYFNGEIDTNAGIGSIYFFYNTIKNKDEYVYSLDILGVFTIFSSGFGSISTLIA